MSASHSRKRYVFLSALMAAFLSLPASGRSPDPLLPTGVCGSPQTMLEATREGNVMVRQAIARGMPWGDKALNEYVNRLGQNLARSSGSQQAFAFYVLYDPRINAQAFPGGYIVVNTGVISVAESEAELAAVLSHEIAHENSCDWRTVPWKGNVFELIVAVPAVLFGGPVGLAVMSASGLSAPVARARANRSAEQRADALAAQYLVRAGYDARAAERFFERLETEQEHNGGDSGGLLATHPRTADRRKQLEKLVPNLPPPPSSPLDESEFLRMRKAVRDYDEIYSRVVGVRVPGNDSSPPELSHRPPAE